MMGVELLVTSLPGLLLGTSEDAARHGFSWFHDGHRVTSFLLSPVAIDHSGSGER